MNAKYEFLIKTGGIDKLCASIYTQEYDDDDEVIKTFFNLKKGFTAEELKDYLDSLDFEYDSGYGTQELFGTIWCADGSWFERKEYDGAETWVHKVCPKIPKELENGNV
ncbi:MAG: hypothetical protein WCO84_05850 [bacterium]